MCRHVWGQRPCLQCRVICILSKVNHVEQDCSSLLADFSGGCLMSALASSYMSKFYMTLLHRSSVWKLNENDCTKCVSYDAECKISKAETNIQNCWFCLFRYAAVYLTAGLENLLEEILLQCLPNETDTILTATMFEHAIANNGDLWGLLQPYAHLNAGRIASGECSWLSVVM